MGMVKNCAKTGYSEVNQEHKFIVSDGCGLVKTYDDTNTHTHTHRVGL